LPVFSVIQTHLSCRFYLAVDFLGLRRSGSWSQIINQARDFPEQFLRHGNLGQLERDVPAMASENGPAKLPDKTVATISSLVGCP